MPMLLLALAALAALLALLAWRGRRRFRRQGQAGATGLLAAARPVSRPPEMPAGLPAPARRYLELALPSSGGPRRLARAELRGHIRLEPGKPWRPWEGTQAWSLSPPGFLWDGKMKASPLASIQVRDSLLDGRGGLVVKLWGWLPLARAGSRPELDHGALQRWLAEALLYPWALLPGPHLRWEEIDQSSARAVVSLGGMEAEGVFRFGRRGLPVSFYTPARWRRLPDGGFAQTPWLGRFGRWRRLGGCLAPTWAQASWLLPEGEFACVRLEVKTLEPG